MVERATERGQLGGAERWQLGGTYGRRYIEGQLRETDGRERDREMAARRDIWQEIHRGTGQRDRW